MAYRDGGPSHLVGVRLEPSGRVHYFDAKGFELEPGDRVTVETDDGPREGRVVLSPGQVLYSDLRGPLLPVLSRSL